MYKSEKYEHNKKITEQFSKQAFTFENIQGHYGSVEEIVKFCRISKRMRVLDLACGTGIVTCELAKEAKEAVGLDITKEMLSQAIKKQHIEKLTNISFELGDVEKLSYENGSFDVVITRYSFHHFLDVKKVFDEMLRVCKIGGKIVVVDIALEKRYEKAFNEMERFRDSSHTRALTKAEFEDLFANERLTNCRTSGYKVEVELEEQLKASFPNEGDDEKIREILKNDIISDMLGVDSHVKEGKIYFSYPISVFSADKID
jgi:ubiquinone/menaquinone biosynthesis C-methylase UbiE